jgi:DNA polymerase III alpha subunit
MTPERYTSPCGCSFEVVGPSPFKSGLPALKLDFGTIPLNCIATWDLISRGDTKGVFQLEKNLGKKWSKELKPEKLEHLAALGALLRPGCLKAVDKKSNMSMTELYCKRKNGLQPTEFYHPALKLILESTYGILTYQEQAMRIAVALAGFNPQEADILRVAIGKKKPDEMSKMKTLFLEKAKLLNIVNETEAQVIFGWIEESQRYSFNKSHAVCYGKIGYQCAYVKAHFPVQFFCSWLFYAKTDSKKKQDEIRELVNDAKIKNIEVYPPDITNLEPAFSTDGEIITFGLSDVKDVGPANVNKILATIKGIEAKYKPISQWNWYDLLIRAGGDISKSAMEPLILVGAMRKLRAGRTKLLNEYSTWRALTQKEQLWVQERADQWDSLESVLEAVGRPKKEGGACNNKNRVEIVQSLLLMLRNQASCMDDEINEIASNEEKYLGIPITCNRVDGKPGERWNTTCKEYLEGKKGQYIVLKVQIDEAREHTIKKGKQENIGRAMGYLKISDGTCAMEDVRCFPDQWESSKHLLVQGRIVEIHGERPRYGDGMNIKEIWEV